jgi:hydroxyacylglutathione hydrolase
MPGRLLADDANAYLTSARRVAAFVSDRPVSFVLGGHIEMDTAGKTFPWQSQYHPHEHVLEMTKQDLLALAAAVSSFNGFYSKRGRFILMNPVHLLPGRPDWIGTDRTRADAGSIICGVAARRKQRATAGGS